jgi:3-oxoadipate enol-lactonase
LLLIMGFGLPGAAWTPWLALMPGFRCIYFDNRGTGESDRPDGPYTIAEMADDTSGLLTALGIASANVYGVSMGGMIAMELTLRRPDQVKKLVLGFTTAGGSTAKLGPPEVYEQMTSAFARMASDSSAALDILMPLLYPPEFIASHPELKQMMMLAAGMMTATPPETLERTAAGVVGFNAYDRLDQIKCPVLIIHGEKDVIIPPENAAIIRSRLPQAELLMIPNAGHAYQAINPVGTHQRIVEWLRG